MRVSCIVLIIVFLAAGCVGTSNTISGIGGGIIIDEFTTVPFKILEGQKAVLKLKLKNTGDHEVEGGTAYVYGYGDDFYVSLVGEGENNKKGNAANFSLEGSQGLLGVRGEETLKTWIVNHVGDLPPGQVFSYNFFVRVCYNYESMAYGKVELMQEDEYLLKLAENKLTPRDIMVKNTNAPIKIDVSGTQPVIAGKDGTVKFKLRINNLGSGFLGACPSTDEDEPPKRDARTLEITVKLGDAKCTYSEKIYLRKGQSREIDVVCEGLATNMPSGTYDLSITANYNYYVEGRATLMVEGTPGKPAGRPELAPTVEEGGAVQEESLSMEENVYVSVIPEGGKKSVAGEEYDEIVTFSEWIKMLNAIENECNFQSKDDIDFSSKCIRDLQADADKDLNLEVKLGGLAIGKKKVEFVERPRINNIYFKSEDCEDETDPYALKDCEKEATGHGYLFQPVRSNDVWLRSYYMGKDDDTRSYTDIKPGTKLTDPNEQLRISLKLLLKSFAPGRETKFPLTLKFELIDKGFEEKKEGLNDLVQNIKNCLTAEGGVLKYEHKDGCSHNAKDLALESEECKSSCDCIGTDLCNYIISNDQVTDENCKKCIGSYLAKDKFAEEVINIVYPEGISSSEKYQIKENIAESNPFLSCSNPSNGEINADCVLSRLENLLGVVQESSREKDITIKERSYAYEFSIRGLSEKQLSCVKKYTDGDTVCENEMSIDECLKLDCFKNDEYFRNKLDENGVDIENGMSEEEIKRVLTNQIVEIMENEGDYKSTCEIYMLELNYDENGGACRPKLKIMCREGLFDLTPSNENKNYIIYYGNQPFVFNSDSVVVTPSKKIRFGYSKLSQDFSKFCENKAIYLEIEPAGGSCSADSYNSCEKCYTQEYQFRISLSGLDCGESPPQNP